MLRIILTCIALTLCPAGAGADSFPVEIQHRFGTARIASAPKKTVSLSFIGHDFLLALGVKPYALRKWYGTDPYGVWEWGHDALGDAQPIVMQGEINIEQIAAMEPDLILGQWSGMRARDYALLSQIAPTIAPRVEFGDYGTPWQEMQRTVGLATGKSAEAEALIDRIETRFETIRNAHPDWQGATSVMVWAGQTGAYTDRDIRGRFLEDLGFRIPESINERGTLDNFYVLISAEDLSPIDVDALVWIDAGGSAPVLNRMHLRPTLRAFAEGREVYADPMLSAALSHSSPLSLDYALDRIVPLIEAAMDGNPGTVVPSSRDAGILPERQ
ncbi:iron complex transport system substrate-binding protein [Ruegeria halocynthiae]|uniref:Iron complex transport system substrate-binding protein n=1 Tax=Ruegeria halocynthiae TaxID=985054 RepID=A0A1H2XY53_9RHOB|nr:iron-siderophore ABC transporter substrate-binding protein [Ruegeria halocynthiae]SDW97863.1 iron complex transport system substrate-binding protein [Ruegeria halocynthiae]